MTHSTPTIEAAISAPTLPRSAACGWATTPPGGRWKGPSLQMVIDAGDALAEALTERDAEHEGGAS